MLLGTKPRALQWIGGALTVLLLVSAVPIAQFYRSYWPRVSHLPRIVEAREASHGGRWTPLSAVSPWVPKALIATEDRSFSTNIGISFEGIGRSLLVDLKTGQFTEGGSTLTQQLVRDTLLSPVKRFQRKISEALLAVLVTVLYSKREILALYLNEVYLGDGAYGIQAASQHYFHVAPQSLTPAQATLLAGLPQNPSGLDPFIHWGAARKRQSQVLESMVADNMMTVGQASHIYRAPLDLAKGERERTAKR
ncbi:biosynthetic peptidoglycan transglycosylase [Sulfobacillus harzensis]|uniref:biosynthetic peptidoglycan transglycosylase n=1 Tax=Sulfobacillus harzensis TaxID=2729629 RepID=UPI001FAB9757|nr:biosynthetic peptidoglycan transglycosylase [Sulfobacillus harzensis]